MNIILPHLYPPWYKNNPYIGSICHSAIFSPKKEIGLPVKKIFKDASTQTEEISFCLEESWLSVQDDFNDSV